MSDFLEGWFRERGIPFERQTVSPGRDNLIARYESPRRPPDRPLRRPSGHGADRRDDDRPVRRRDPRGAALRAGGVRHQGGDGGDAHRLGPAGPRAARGLGLGRHGVHRRRGIHPHRLEPPGDEPARGRPGRSWPSRRCSTSSPATRGRSAGRSGREGSPATARPRSSARTRSTGWPRSWTRWPSTPRSWPAPPTRSSGRRASRSAGSRGGRASTSSPTGARSRSTAA